MTAAPILARNDRHVRLARLCVRDGAPRQTLGFLTEEALRLSSLPGEDEGRVYYFRSLHISGLPENGDRRIWLDAFQLALQEQARCAIHGASDVAPGAPAVFFHSRQDGCATLLDTIARGKPLDAWFWPAVSGAPSGSDAAALVEAAIAGLSRSEASWFAVAAALFAVQDPVTALRLLSEDTIRRWIAELDADRTEASARPTALSARAAIDIDRVIAEFGLRDIRVVWLASLAVILSDPACLDTGAAVKRARRWLESAPPGGAHRDADPSPPGCQPCAPQSPEPRPTSEAGSVAAPLLERGTGVSDPTSQVRAVARPSPGVRPPALPGRESHCLGEPTAGAGLYFLLNALRFGKFPDRPSDPRFLAHFFQRVAHRAGIAPSDPILLWTTVTLEENEPYVPDDRELRAWLRKVRRWCWRNGCIGVSEIVRRSGTVTLTRTDLDVSLPLDAVDIRIRRIGLDIDPGWLPWFGRVVRFHYRYRGEFS